MTRKMGVKCCARCGRSQPRARMFRSRPTGRLYCVDSRACDAATKRVPKRVAA